MILLAVNFHYVSRERVASPRAIFPVTVSELAAQVELLARHFEFVDRDLLERAVVGGRPLPERACLITFDDGLRQQAELALPALLELGVVPLFLIPGQPLAEGRALYVHKVHHMREVLDREQFADVLTAPLARTGFSLDDVSEEQGTTAYAYDEPEEARLKFLLNRVLPFDIREQVVDEGFAQIVESERAFCEQLYMSSALVGELEQKHHAIGAHSYAHRPLALLDPAELRRDLDASAAALEAVTGLRPHVLSYPHGSLEAVDRSVASVAAAVGFRVGFTMERAFNRTLADPLLLARIDVNDALGGSRPLIEVDESGGFRTLGRMTDARLRYRDELAAAARA